MVRSPAIPYVLSSTVQSRVHSELVVTRTLRLYPLVDAGVSKLGLSFTDLHGDAYAKTWEASGNIHATTSADGILYTRSEERRVGKESVSTGRSRWYALH